MTDIEKVLEKMKASPAGLRFIDLKKVCEHYFGSARQSGTSHAVFRTPWPGDPRVNIQNDKGKAKVYQVRQVLAAIQKLKGHGGES
ncbi:MAG: toxin HicA [Proteobacteria bacterium]|uniref:toxin HicA n=1 Tax=Piscinibacter sp. TaxID=1903157 RepID=UPI0011D6B5DD|nr:toxin HicA [Piscinibacter sp.]MBP5989527.1 toxin HicA [Piscinibacter sp.]MBP6027212.1 toxin HicA [Piscinibacter sp.]MBS0440478.1 toxin HicA [Pseudomonadota bacterium]TXH58269.1 MAG: toxin HicA [Burkholderiaceae bacterium]